MAKDLYQILGVSRDVSKDEITKAYRALAKKLHPDLHPGDREAETRFKEVSSAYQILKDKEKRKRYDAGEIDEHGHEVHREFYRQYADTADNPYASSAGFEDLGDIFSDLFGGGRDGGEFKVRMRGADVRYAMDVEFMDAVKGATRRLTLPDGKVLDVTIPQGLRDGQVLRLAGKGMPGAGGGPAGDAYIETRVRPHRQYRRRGDDLEMELPITLAEAHLGAKVRVPTPWGPVTMTVPRESNTGDTLRLKGKGVQGRTKPRGGEAGDLLVHLKVVLPDRSNAELKELLRKWEETHPYDPRKNMEE